MLSALHAHERVLEELDVAVAEQHVLAVAIVVVAVASFMSLR
jgi:hypothetical protein